MTREEVVKFLAGEDCDLNKLVAEVKAEKEKRAEREEWQQVVAEAQDFLLDALVNYIETIFGETLTKEEIDDFKKGLNNMTAQLIKMKECGKPVVEPKVWIPKKEEEDFLKAFAKML